MSVAGTAVVALRESLEALLVIGILLGMARKLDRPGSRKPILIGAFSGLGASIVLGVLIFKLAEDLFDKYATQFEVIASLVAVGILTYMIVWMYKHTMEFVGGQHGKTKDAMLAGRFGALWGLAFIIVVREGLETVLFIATQVADTTVAQAMLGLAIGIAISIVLAILVFRGVIRLSIKNFFAITGALLIVFSAGLLGYAAHEAEEVGWIPESPDAWDWSGFLPHKCGDDVTVGCSIGGLLAGIMSYRATPSIVDLSVWALYAGGMGYWYLAPILRRRGEPETAE